jgi:pre-rRNA-processing protein TSR1
MYVYGAFCLTRDDVQRHPSYTDVVKSKEDLLVQCGFRRFRSTPIFSQHNINCDKHKFERFLQPDRTSVASVFAPITFTPAPVLLFKEVQGRPRLVASGTLLGADPNRIMLKKVVLTGYPYKIHKRTAVIREMFYNPGTFSPSRARAASLHDAELSLSPPADDVRWFKPVELYTKQGRTGHILEPLGTLRPPPPASRCLHALSADLCLQAHTV